MSEQTPVSHESGEQEKRIEIIPLPEPMDDPTFINILDRSCVGMRNLGLTDIYFIEELGKVTSIIDLDSSVIPDPDNEFPHAITRSYLFLGFFMDAAYQAHFTNINKYGSEAEKDILDFNLDQQLQNLAKNKNVYNSLVDYLSGKNTQNALALVEAIQRPDNVVDLSNNPMLGKLMMDRYDEEPEFREAIFRSNDSILQQNMMFTIKDLITNVYGTEFKNEQDDSGVSIPGPEVFSDLLFDEEVLGPKLHEDVLYKLSDKYIIPLLKAVAQEPVNKFAMYNVVNLFREVSDDVRRTEEVHDVYFASNDEYQFYRGFEEKMLQIAMMSPETHLKMLAFDYFHQNEGTVRVRANYFTAIAESTRDGAMPDQKLRSWMKFVFEENSQERKLAEAVFEVADTQEAFQNYLRSSLTSFLRGFAMGTDNIGHMDVEYWTNKHIGFYQLRTDEDVRFLIDLQEKYPVPLLAALRIKSMLSEYNFDRTPDNLS